MDEVFQLLEVSIGDGEEIHYGHDLFLQGERIVLAQPQLGLELVSSHFWHSLEEFTVVIHLDFNLY